MTIESLNAGSSTGAPAPMTASEMAAAQGQLDTTEPPGPMQVEQLTTAGSAAAPSPEPLGSLAAVGGSPGPAVARRTRPRRRAKRRWASTGGAARPGSNASEEGRRAASDNGAVTINELTADDSGTTVQARVGDVLAVLLAENATTGFRWHVDTIDDAIDLVSDGYRATPTDVPGEQRVGSGGIREFPRRTDERRSRHDVVQTLAGVGRRFVGHRPRLVRRRRTGVITSDGRFNAAATRRRRDGDATGRDQQ